MATDGKSDWYYVLVVLGSIALVPITWYVFWEIIQPILMNLSPLFAEQSGGGRVGRAPDSFAQLALFATFFLGLFIYHILLILLFDDMPANELLLGLYGLIIVVPIMIIKNYILPKIGRAHV